MAGAGHMDRGGGRQVQAGSGGSDALYLVSPGAASSLPPEAPLTPLVPGPRPERGPNLRRLLVGFDALAAMVAWVIALAFPDGPDDRAFPRVLALISVVAVAVAASVALNALQRLYLARVCNLRAVETFRLGRTALFSLPAVIGAAHLVSLPLSVAEAVAGVVLATVLLTVQRAAYRAWLSAGRRQGRFTRPVVVVGANEEGLDLCHLVRNHPDLGFHVCGVVGDKAEFTAAGFPAPWLGEVTDAVGAAEACSATGVLVASSAVPPNLLNRLARDTLRAGLHVQVSSGLRGIAHRRLKWNPMAHEPIFYLEPISLSGAQMVLKRAIDVMIASVGLLLVLPVLVVAGLVIKLADGGPVLFRQRRVGRNGVPYTMFKLRTMVPDAEQRRKELLGQNERQGPLFKLVTDPRVTPFGKVLRATSIDELPQLFNVLTGKMSLVGPRPALPEEVAQFDEELLNRSQVPPGITGLWQVEGRDNPSFAVYRRLDIFYVENWSVGLDLAILLSTFGVVVCRAYSRTVQRRRRRNSSAPVPALPD